MQLMCHKMSSMLSLQYGFNQVGKNEEVVAEKQSSLPAGAKRKCKILDNTALEISTLHNKRNAFKYTNGSRDAGHSSGDFTNSKQSISLFVVYDLGNLLGVICSKIKQET